MDFQGKYQTVLINLAYEVRNLIAYPKNRARFTEQAQLFIDGFDNWKRKVLEGQLAAKDDPKLNVGREPTIGADEWWNEVLKNKPDGYQIYDQGSFYHENDDVIPEIPGCYLAPELPLNPLDTLLPREDWQMLFASKDTEIRERTPVNKAEDLMCEYFLLAVVHAHKGKNIAVVDKNHEAVWRVWLAYEDLEGNRELYLGPKIRKSFQAALVEVAADLKSKGKKRPLPVPPRAGLILEKLRSLPLHQAMTTPQLLDWLSRSKEIEIDEKTLRVYLKELEPYGVRNRPKVGFYVDNSRQTPH